MEIGKEFGVFSRIEGDHSLLEKIRWPVHALPRCCLHRLLSNRAQRGCDLNPDTSQHMSPTATEVHIIRFCETCRSPFWSIAPESRRIRTGRSAAPTLLPHCDIMLPPNWWVVPLRGGLSTYHALLSAGDSRRWALRSWSRD